MVVSNAWLFVRGPQSVRMVRAITAEGLVHLTLRGPVDATSVYVGTSAACDRYQSGLELNLSAEGFRLEQRTSDRRARDIRGVAAGWDRRRPDDRKDS